MGTRNPKVDAYIAAAQPFARPVLEHVRELVHANCPETVEVMKWSMPHFDYKGMFCGMAAFKGHCTFGFWKGNLVLGSEAAQDAMGQFGRITCLEDLPGDSLIAGYIRQAMRLNDDGVKSRTNTRNAKPKPAVVVPADLQAALDLNATAQSCFAAFSQSARREYVEWLNEAKRAETRQKRLVQAVEWIAEGKGRNWKYENC
jgi:uncharacterized protein YdeI (YjbR/CyaY-like superfamily)